MKAMTVAAVVAMAVAVGGCESRGGSALLGGAAGAAAGAGTYEYRLNEEKKRVEEAHAQGKMDKREYDIRMDQIRRDSLVR